MSSRALPAGQARAEISGEPAHPLVRLSLWVRAGLFRELNPTERAVLTVYAAFANKKGTAWPAAETVGRLTGHSRRSVFEALRVLRRLKLLEQVGRTTRKGMEEFGAIGPMIYIVAEPPASLPEGFSLSVRAARTAGPIRVRTTRTHRTAKGDGGRFVKGLSARGEHTSVRPSDSLSACERHSTVRATRTGSGSEVEKEGEKEQGEGEGIQGEREPRRGDSAPPGPPGVSSHQPGGEPEGEAGKGKARATEEETVERLRVQLEASPVEKRQSVAQHLLVKGYPTHLVKEALIRVNGGGRA